jgi:hypothetical protein
VREIRSLGSVEGARGNSRPYSDTDIGLVGSLVVVNVVLVGHGCLPATEYRAGSIALPAVLQRRHPRGQCVAGRLTKTLRSRRASATTSAVGPAIQSSDQAACSALTREGVTAQGAESFRPTSARLRERGATRKAASSRRQHGGASRHSGTPQPTGRSPMMKYCPSGGRSVNQRRRGNHRAWK